MSLDNRIKVNLENRIKSHLLSDTRKLEQTIRNLKETWKTNKFHLITISIPKLSFRDKLPTCKLLSWTIKTFNSTKPSTSPIKWSLNLVAIWISSLRTQTTLLINQNNLIFKVLRSTPQRTASNFPEMIPDKACCSNKVSGKKIT